MKKMNWKEMHINNNGSYFSAAGRGEYKCVCVCASVFKTLNHESRGFLMWKNMCVF